MNYETANENFVKIVKIQNAIIKLQTEIEDEQILNNLNIAFTHLEQAWMRVHDLYSDSTR